jgi:hypothetical protein
MTSMKSETKQEEEDSEEAQEAAFIKELHVFLQHSSLFPWCLRTHCIEKDAKHYLCLIYLSIEETTSNMIIRLMTRITDEDKINYEREIQFNERGEIVKKKESEKMRTMMMIEKVQKQIQKRHNINRRTVNTPRRNTEKHNIRE